MNMGSSTNERMSVKNVHMGDREDHASIKTQSRENLSMPAEEYKGDLETDRGSDSIIKT